MASNGTKRPETARFGVVLGYRRPLAAGEKIHYFFSIAEALNLFCAASYHQTTVAYLRTFEGQQFRPPTQGIAQNSIAWGAGYVRHTERLISAHLA